MASREATLEYIPIVGAPTYYLTPEQSRRMLAAPGLTIEPISANTHGASPLSRTGERVIRRPVDHAEQPSPAAAKGGRLRRFGRKILRFGRSSSPATRVATRRPRYEPLAPEGEIRVLIIEKGTKSEPVKCHLEKRSLRDPRPYEALSYTWHAPIRTRYLTKNVNDPRHEFSAESQLAAALSGAGSYRTEVNGAVYQPPPVDVIDENALTRDVVISVDGSPCDVTGNLAAALRQLRQPDADRCLWVDALCIDQQNDEEKSQQLPQMSQIYQRSNTVRIWLGPAADGSEAAMALVELMWDIDHDGANYPTIMVARERSNESLLTLASIEDLTILLMRPWFTRRWTIQELAFADNAIVHCGSEQVEWSKLSYAIAFLQVHRIELNALRERRLYAECRPGSYRQGYHEALAAEIHTFISGGIVRKVSANEKAFDRLLDMETLLSCLYTLQCGDPRDTIYTLLALAKDTYSSDKWYPDYEVTNLALYIDLVMWIVTRKKSLNILCRPWAQPIMGRPSWIQSYRPAATRHEGGFDLDQRREMFVGQGLSLRFKAAACTPAAAELLPPDVCRELKKGYVLKVTGLRVGSIVAMAPSAHQGVLPGPWRDMFFSNRGIWPEDRNLKRAMARDLQARAKRVDRNGRPIIDMDRMIQYASFADLLVAGHESNDRYQCHEYGTMCEALWSAESPYRTRDGNVDISKRMMDAAGIGLVPSVPPYQMRGFSDTDVHDFLTTLRLCTQNRAIARTENEKIALVDHTAKPGDEVCILFGCNVPVVLRQEAEAPHGSSTFRGLYKFVGEAYVQGIMQGEAFTKEAGGSACEFWLC